MPISLDMITNTDPDLSRYMTHLRAQGYSPATIRAKLSIVGAVARAASVDPANLTQQAVEEYFARELGAWSRRKYLEHLRAYAQWAGITGLTDDLRSPRRPRAIPKPINEHDLGLLLQASSGRTHCYVVFGAFAGMRTLEIAAAQGRDLEQGHDGWTLRIHGKGDREDVIPVGDTFTQVFLRRRQETGAGPLFPGVTANAVQQALRTLAERVGVRASAHQLRHRYGTQLYLMSRDLLLVQRLMRHSSPTTTAGYAQLVDGPGARLVAQLPYPRTREEPHPPGQKP
jgi:integrase